MDLITFPASDGLVSSIQASWSIFHPGTLGRLFVLEPEEASCIDIYEPVSQYHVAICQGSPSQCQDWVNRHYQLLPEDYFTLRPAETSKALCCRHNYSDGRRLIIIWMCVPSREDASCVFGLLAHECLHAAYAIMDGMGMKPDFANEELTAYTIQFLMNSYTQSIGIPVPITE